MYGPDSPGGVGVDVIGVIGLPFRDGGRCRALSPVTPQLHAPTSHLYGFPHPVLPRGVPAPTGVRLVVTGARPGGTGRRCARGYRIATLLWGSCNTEEQTGS
ncbi:hypothetical protein GCM10010357_24560 [Streptomyces luteireticuli]|uniref:Uncharacterized protein n=1 Tax=Streptomyces luteireticuli TaxID=173858 RepID=A0ABP3IGP9_9ACTN